MINDDFYDILDKELQTIIDEHKDRHGELAGHKNNAPNQQKSYAFLIWFLDFYGRTSEFRYLITDGADDMSCDIIFQLPDSFDETIFYVVQAKWNNKKRTSNNFSSQDVKSALNDFENLFETGNFEQKTENESKNKILQSQVDNLLAHRRKNGKIKFIFLSLGNKSEKADENIRVFRKRHKRTEVEFVDFHKIKRDYIDRQYKKIDILNPLEFTNESPEETKVKLKIERLGVFGNQIHINKYKRVPHQKYNLNNIALFLSHLR